ncbi:MAG: type 4a pilus biogenesis protein PilO, partial [Clostridia bacterium]|nr:type 4a pilus biogenesis protein PilO [Clostridia bacterium]
MGDLKALLLRILPFVLVAVVLIGVGFTIRTQVLALAEARNAAQYEQLAISAAKARLDTLLQYKADESMLQERTARAELLMPAETGEGAVVRDIQATADAANARFLTVRFGELAPGEKYNEIPMQITFEGRYEEMLSLLDGL